MDNFFSVTKEKGRGEKEKGGEREEGGERERVLKK